MNISLLQVIRVISYHFAIEREPTVAGEIASKELKAVTTRESAYYALFSLNTIYLVSITASSLA